MGESSLVNRSQRTVQPDCCAPLEPEHHHAQGEYQLASTANFR